MMATLQNPQFTTRELEVLMSNVRSNRADVEDYERLEKFLLMKGVSYSISSRLRYFGINSFSEYIRKRESDDAPASITGEIIGAISAIKKFMSY